MTADTFNMIIGITGNLSSGKKEVAKYLEHQGFTRLCIGKSKNLISNGSTSTNSSEIWFETSHELLAYVTGKWLDKFVIVLETVDEVEVLSKRPFFLHLAVEAPLMLRYKRYLQQCTGESRDTLSIEQFIERSDNYQFKKSGLNMTARAHVAAVNDAPTIQLLYIKLNNLNLDDPTRLRPDWDAYFMKLADLAAQRANCMKRRVGCVLVRNKTVIATGYNGTPRGLHNCNEGGCSRCNSGEGSGSALATCLCLHAEENALLEAGRDRIGSQATIYCNTCPCLTCSIKIVQSGIKEVVYNESYSMDEYARRVMTEGGIVLRQYTPPVSGVQMSD